MWPLDPLGPYPGDRGPGRRAAVESGAALVRVAEAALAASADQLPFDLRPPLPGRPGEWRADVDRLLAERERLLAARHGSTVELPAQLSVSQLVELDRDPASSPARIRRPVPRAPAPWARRGTRFHTWLEQRWNAQTLLDVDELPGAADETAEDRTSTSCARRSSAASGPTRTPAQVEVPFEMALGESGSAGRCCAGGWTPCSGGRGRLVRRRLEDRTPTDRCRRRGRGRAARRLPPGLGAPVRPPGRRDLHRVRAAFHYVRSDETVEPAHLLDADGLRALIAGGAPDR